MPGGCLPPYKRSKALHWLKHAGEQHHTDQLQAMPIREMSGCRNEARTGGRHSQAKAGQ